LHHCWARLQFAAQPLAVGDVQRQQSLELGEQGVADRGAMPAGLQPAEQFTLSRDQTFAIRNVTIGQGQVVLEDGPTHTPDRRCPEPTRQSTYQGTFMTVTREPACSTSCRRNCQA
jgi:hypothetical protein